MSNHDLPSHEPCDDETGENDRLRKITRRNFLGGMVGAAAAVNTLRAQDELERAVERKRWPPGPLEVMLVEQSERLVGTKAEFMVFGGFGQDTSKNAATELFLESDRKRPVSYADYPNQDARIAELAMPVLDHIIARDIEELHLVGVSMGTHTMLLIMNYLHRFVGWHRDIGGSYKDVELPTIESITSYSSPANIEDAKQVKGAKLLEMLHRLSGGHFPLTEKYIFSLFDGKGDFEKTMTGDLGHIVNDSLRQTFNHTSPSLGRRGLRELLSMDMVRDWKQFEGIIGPWTKFNYVESSGGDNTVDTETAFAKISDAMQKLGVEKIEKVVTLEPGHADTAPSARALARAGLLEYEPKVA